MNTTDDPYLGEPIHPALRATLLAMGWVACLSGVLGNLLIITTLLSQPALRSLHNLYIGNLALADLVISAYSVPFWLVDVGAGRHPVVNATHCVCNAFITCCAFGTSVLTLVIISLNRYLSVCHHSLFVRVFSKQRTLTLCLLTWVLGVSLCTPNLLSLRPNATGYDHEFRICAFGRDVSGHYSTWYTFILLLLPSVIVGFSNAAIFLHWKRSRDRLHKWKKTQTGESGGICDGDAIETGVGSLSERRTAAAEDSTTRSQDADGDTARLLGQKKSVACANDSAKQNGARSSPAPKSLADDSTTTCSCGTQIDAVRLHGQNTPVDCGTEGVRQNGSHRSSAPKFLADDSSTTCSCGTVSNSARLRGQNKRVTCTSDNKNLIVVSKFSDPYTLVGDGAPGSSKHSHAGIAWCSDGQPTIFQHALESCQVVNGAASKPSVCNALISARASATSKSPRCASMDTKIIHNKVGAGDLSLSSSNAVFPEGKTTDDAANELNGDSNKKTEEPTQNVRESFVQTSRVDDGGRNVDAKNREKLSSAVEDLTKASITWKQGYDVTVELKDSWHSREYLFSDSKTEDVVLDSEHNEDENFISCGEDALGVKNDTISPYHHINEELEPTSCKEYVATETTALVGENNQLNQTDSEQHWPITSLGIQQCGCKSCVSESDRKMLYASGDIKSVRMKIKIPCIVEENNSAKNTVKTPCIADGKVKTPCVVEDCDIVKNTAKTPCIAEDNNMSKNTVKTPCIPEDSDVNTSCIAEDSVVKTPCCAEDNYSTPKNTLNTPNTPEDNDSGRTPSPPKTSHSPKCNKPHRSNLSSSDVSMIQSLLIVFVCCVLLYLPLATVALIYLYSHVRVEIGIWTVALAFLNHGINWVLYGLLNRNFREGYVRQFLCCFRACRAASSSPADLL